MSSHGGFLGPQSVWLGLGVAALLILGWRAMSPPPDTPKEPVAVRSIGTGEEARLEQITRADCLRRQGRVWAVLQDASVECISYVASPKAEGAETAVVFFGGDIPEQHLMAEMQDTARLPAEQRVNVWAQRFGVPAVIVGRPGLMGSSGFHMLGGRRDEGYVLDAALDALKERLSIRRLALAGQSGGSRIIAQLMVIGRRDISCAAMGSGAYDVPRLRGGGRSTTNIFGDPGRRYLVPLLKVAEVPASRDRRSFVIGDPRDTVAPFPEQQQWAEKLGALGHHVVVIEVEAKDPEHHGASQAAVTAAAMCAKGASDDEIRAALRTR